MILTRRLRRMIAVLSVVLTRFSRLPFMSGSIPTAAVAAAYWLGNTLNTAVGVSANTGPRDLLLACARIQLPVALGRGVQARTAAARDPDEPARRAGVLRPAGGGGSRSGPSRPGTRGSCSCASLQRAGCRGSVAVVDRVCGLVDRSSGRAIGTPTTAGLSGGASPPAPVCGGRRGRSQADRGSASGRAILDCGPCQWLLLGSL